MKTLAQIFFANSTEVQLVMAGEELSNELYEVLFDYFCDSGEMPYGTATARDGDPFEWITNYIKNACPDEIAVYDRPAIHHIGA